MTLSKASYDLEFETIEETYSKIIVTVKENATLNFNFMKNITSKYYNIESTFTFDKNYNLISYRRDQDFYSVFTESLDTSFTNIDVDNIYDKYYKIKLEDINKKSTDYNNAINDDYVGKTCDNEYNRDDALSYAKKYINRRNTNDWDIYDDYGGNCQNFGSQVLYAGGIPKDVIGDDVWKYYSAVANNTNNKTGRSSSWTTVGNFYNYAKNNTGYGLCATVDANVYYALPGDIMQVGYDDEFIHTIVVSGVIKKDNNVIDVITNSNTTDFENVPISSFSSTSIRLIKIDGWNNY